MLKFYENEDNIFRVERVIILTNNRAKIIANKLCRHFKFVVSELKFWGKKRCGFSSYLDGRVKVCNNPDLLLLVHELAHQFCFQVLNVRGHTKKLMMVIARFIKYCRKKKYWDE